MYDEATIERFMRFVMPVPESGCWLWTGATLRHGYGCFHVTSKRSAQAHRIAYEIFKGPIQQGLTIDHLCKVKPCVNPDHMEAVTQRENVLRGEAKAAQQARQTSCKNGHPLDGANLMVDGNHRHCRTCYVAYQCQYNERRRAARSGKIETV